MCGSITQEIQLILQILKSNLPGTTVSFSVYECFEFWTNVGFSFESFRHYHPEQLLQQTICVDVFLEPNKGYCLKLLHSEYGIIFLPIKHYLKMSNSNIYVDGIRYKNWIRKMLKLTKNGQ